MKKQALIILLLVFVGAVLGSYFTYSWYIQKDNHVQAEIKETPVDSGESSQVSYNDPSIVGGDFVVKAVEKIGPSVVFITTKSIINVSSSPFRLFPDHPFEHFFFDPFQDSFGPRERTGSGSGIIISEDGMILTNQHVIEEADTIKVKLTGVSRDKNDDSNIYDASIVGQDKLTDIAIIKIDAKNLPAAELGDSDAIKVGEWVVAVGNPLGYEHTVTVGVLSAMGRDIPTMADREYPNLLQTDAAINPGNSGGPLANLQGEVIGMNTMISAQGQGIGFAIPINTIKTLKEQLIQHGRIARAFIGIQMQPMDEAKAEYLGMPKVEGVLVSRVFDGTPAADAGLQRGDVIIEIQGTRISSPEDLQKQIRSFKINEKIMLKVWRNKSFTNLNVTVGEMPDPDEIRRGRRR